MSTIEQSYTERVQAEIREITQPLVNTLGELDEAIKKNEREHAELVKTRRQLRTVVKGINPDLVEPYHKNGRGQGKKNTPGSANNQVSPEKLAAFKTWLQAHRDKINEQGGIHASGIVNGNGDVLWPDWDVPIRNQSQLSKALQLLHEQNLVRFDHTGSGGAKYFTVI